MNTRYQSDSDYNGVEIDEFSAWFFQTIRGSATVEKSFISRDLYRVIFTNITDEDELKIARFEHEFRLKKGKCNEYI